MASAIQSMTRGAIRRAIGQNLGIVILGTATSTVDTTSLIDTLNLTGGDDEHNNKQVLIYSPVGSIVAGETKRVSDFDGATSDATTTAFSANITSGDAYEMWHHRWTVADINDAINQAIIAATAYALQVKETHSMITEASKNLYDILSGYTHVSKVEYATSIGTGKTIHACDAVFDESVDGDVATSIDTTFYKQGSAANKLVVAAGASAGDILATDSIASLDLSGCTEVHLWLYSSVALSAGDLQLLLDNTASCASPVETLNIPATSANTWTHHIISLANPQSDTAIISVGVKMAVDKGAFTLYADDIKAQSALSVVYRPLPDEYWTIAKGSTPYLELTNSGLSTAGTNTQVRVTGFQIASQLSSDSATSEIDPNWIIAWVTGRLLVTHARNIDIQDKEALSRYWMGEAERRLPSITTSQADGRSVS